jgi:phosphatidate cytidylyltransferase
LEIHLEIPHLRSMDKNLIQRIITGTLFVVVLVGAIWWSAWSMAALFLLITVLGLWEFYGLAEKAGAQPQKIYGVVAGALVVVLPVVVKGMMYSRMGQPVAMGLLLIPLLFLPFFIELWRKKENPFANIGWTLMGIIYIAVPFAILAWAFAPAGFISYSFNDYGRDFVPSSRHLLYDHKPLLTFFILIWTSDTMAYVCGRLFGRHKLWERISPKKTWEGFLGGLVFTVFAAGMIANWFMANNWHYKQEAVWMITAVVISVTGMLGDLSESLFKRSIGVKDSGTILPGHGGILDRFDALFLAVPFGMTAYWLAQELLPIRWFIF